MFTSVPRERTGVDASKITLCLTMHQSFPMQLCHLTLQRELQPFFKVPV